MKIRSVTAGLFALLLLLLLPATALAAAAAHQVDHQQHQHHAAEGDHRRARAEVRAPDQVGDDGVERGPKHLAGGGRERAALTIAGLGRAIDRKLKTYSQGMRQRLGIAQSLLRKPELLILDEPTNGLDPGEMREVRRSLQSLAGEGITVNAVAPSAVLTERIAKLRNEAEQRLVRLQRGRGPHHPAPRRASGVPRSRGRRHRRSRPHDRPAPLAATAVRQRHR